MCDHLSRIAAGDIAIEEFTSKTVCKCTLKASYVLRSFATHIIFFFFYIRICS